MEFVAVQTQILFIKSYKRIYGTPRIDKIADVH